MKMRRSNLSSGGLEWACYVSIYSRVKFVCCLSGEVEGVHIMNGCKKLVRY